MLKDFERWHKFQQDFIAFSDKTFGEKSTYVSKLAHMKEEMLEIESKPDDKFEWADAIILYLDAARKSPFPLTRIAFVLVVSAFRIP